MKVNLHEAQNFSSQHPNARDLTCTGRYPELIQYHDRKAGKTYLYIEDYGAGQYSPDDDVVVSDVCVLDYKTGRMEILRQEDIDQHRLPWYPRPESNRRPSD